MISGEKGNRMGRLEGKRAIVTGAGQGMGEAIARRFVEEGALVMLADVKTEATAAITAELGERANSQMLDVTSGVGWQGVIARAHALFGGIDILVNNAGITGPSIGTLDLTEDTFSRVCAVNQTGVFLGMQAVIPSMLAAGGGSIINVSSISGLIANYGTNNAAYAASKFAVRGLTKFAAIEFAEQKIRVNSIHPGYTRTPMMTASLNEEQITIAAQAIPNKRVADPSEIANLALFLASDESAYVTGAEHVIDGGFVVV